ncbi:MAG: DUF935 family protein [Rikenellaceae bacterium]
MKTEKSSVVLSTNINKALTALPNPSRVLRNKSATMEIFHQVAAHPDVFPQIQSYKSALGGLNVLPQASNNSICKFFSDYFRRFPLRELVRSSVSARDYGFAVMEITEYSQMDGKTVPSRIELCSPELFFFDPERRLRMRHKTVKEGVDIFATYPGKFLLCQNEATLTNPYGVGLLDIAYWIAVGLNGNFEFMMQFAEDDGRDKWIATYPPGASQEEIDSLLATLISLRNNGVAAFAEGISVEPKAMIGRTSSNDLYRNIDEMLRRKIEKLWTGTDLTMQVAGKGGYASSESGLTIREDALEDGKTLVLSAINQIANIICYLNNLPEVPELTVQLPRALSKTIAETDKLYYDMGLKPTKNLFLKRGYAEDDFFIDTTPKEVKSADFAADTDEIEPLMDVFESYATRLKKKSLKM